MRTPNRRWKVSYSICCERCRIMWLDLYKVRRLCQLTFGYDPLIEGWDQKPFHFNESGSHMKKTLHWKGVVEVPLKECASAVRSRWSANTYTSTHPDRFDEFPPLRILFKGGPVVLERCEDMLISLCAGGDFGNCFFVSADRSNDWITRWTTKCVLPPAISV